MIRHPPSGADALPRVFRMVNRRSSPLPGVYALSRVFQMPNRSTGPFPGADVQDGSWDLFLSGVETGTPPAFSDTPRRVRSCFLFARLQSIGL